MMRRPFSPGVLSLLAVLLVLWSCGDDSTSPSADTQPPEVTIASPTTEATWQTGDASLTISGTASDDVGVTEVTWAVGGGTTGNATGTTSWSATVPLSPGSNTVTIRAEDAAGNPGTASLTVTVDASGPTVALLQPTSEDEHLTSETPVEVSGTASDQSGLDRVEWSIEGGDSGTAQGTTSWIIPGLDLEEGTNVLTVTAFDEHDNSSSATLTLILDQTEPTLALSQPVENGGHYNTMEEAVIVSGTASDAGGLERIEWSVQGGASAEATGTDDWQIEELPLEHGENQVTVTAFDRAGNEATATFTVLRYEALAEISMSPSVVLTNSNQQIRVTVAVDPDLQVAAGGVRLVAVDAAGAVVEEFGTLEDDGDLENGDEILGDGVYSALLVISRSTPEDLRVQAVAAVTGGATAEARSPIRILEISPPTSSTADQLLLEVQHDAAASLDASLSQGTSLTTAVSDLVQEIAGREGVADVESTGETSISITYESGLIGGLLLTKTDASGTPTTRGGALVQSPQVQGQTLRPAPTITSLSTADQQFAISRSVSADTTKRAKGRTVPLAQQTRGTPPPSSAGATATSGSSGPNEILNRKVLIYAPYEAVWDPYNEGPDLVAMLEASDMEFDVTYLSNQQATVEALEILTDYGLVVLATHGSAGRHILTGEVATEEKREQYDAQRQAGQVVVWTYIEIDEDEEGAAIREDVFGVTDTFIDALAGTFPQSLIVNNSCESTLREDLTDAFLAKGAETYMGYSAIVSSAFAVEMVLELIEPMVDVDLASVGDAFTSDQIDPHGSWGAEFELRGSEQLRYSVEFGNSGFEAGNLTGWTALGDGRVISRLGTENPVEGQYMGIISTGLGFTTSSGAIYQTFVLPEDAEGMRFDWNFISEEFLDWIGTEFQDRFKVSLIRPGQPAEDLFSKSVDDIAEEWGCPQDGGPECELISVSPDIIFDQGDVYMTGWQTLELDLSAYQGQLITLVFSASDVGDSIYDTAILLDDLVLY